MTDFTDYLASHEATKTDDGDTPVPELIDKPIFETPITDHLESPSLETKNWVRLIWIRPVTPKVKPTVADAERFLRNTNHDIQDFLIPRPGPLTDSRRKGEQATPRLAYDRSLERACALYICVFMPVLTFHRRLLLEFRSLKRPVWILMVRSPGQETRRGS